MSARPLLERMNFDAALAAHLGTDFLNTLEVEQIQGGHNDGLFVAHDAVAKLLGTRADNASQKLKNIVCPVPEPLNDKQREENRKKEENFPSCKIIKGNNKNVILVNFVPLKLVILI